MFIDLHRWCWYSCTTLHVQRDQNTLGSKLAVVEGGRVNGDEVADE
jgi:hypothetical protein